MADPIPLPELFPESALLLCTQCRVCGRLLFTGRQLGSIIEEFLIALAQRLVRGPEFADVLVEFNEGLVLHLSTWSDEECAECNRRREAGRQSAWGARFERQADTARAFYGSSAYVKEERAHRALIRRRIERPNAPQAVAADSAPCEPAGQHQPVQR